MINNKSIFKLLSDFVSIQSISTDKSRHSEIIKAVEFLKKEIKSLGFEIKTYQKDNCSPLIIGYLPSMIRSSKDGKSKTIGVYAHYDVQPENPVNKWNSQPFELTKKNGKLFSRGVADDKGHIIQTLVAIRKIVETQDFASLQNNIVLIFEGEEETGSENFEYLISQAKKDLEEVDVFYVLDFGMETSNQPEIFYGLRGLICFEIEIKIGENDLHSGVYGNQIDNPIQILSELFSKIKDAKTRRILIPHFYDKIKYKSKDNYWLSTKIHPSFDINGISGGYTGEGVKTIIPASVSAKFSFRLIENQTPDAIEKLVNDFIKKNLPKTVKYSLKTLGKLSPFYTDIDNKYIKVTDKIFTKVFGKKSLFTRSGGSIGAATTLSKLFNKPLILTGFTLVDCNIHAPNENIDEEMFYKGIVSLEKIFSL
ncbi:MAG: M20/M25/M40 family metallo-hydrolase [Patescibacteria group bacterium]